MLRFLLGTFRSTQNELSHCYVFNVLYTDLMLKISGLALEEQGLAHVLVVHYQRRNP